MIITNKYNTRSGIYDGFTTNLLLGELNTGSHEISIQITEISPNEMQFIHSHEQEQCYYILTGIGEIVIDDQSSEVREGDAIYIPSNSNHGLKNTGKHVLTYLATNRSFGTQKEKEIWPNEVGI